MAEGWRFLLARSHDMELVGELKRASSRTLTVDNNKSGSAQCDYPVDAPHAGEVSPWETCLVAQRDDDWYWSGPVQQRVADLAGNKLTIPAVGWFERLNRILLQEEESFADEDAGSIASSLLDLARAQDPTLPITIGAVETTQNRTITCGMDASIGAEIQRLAEVESGYDWYVDPRTRQLNVVERRGVDRQDCKWFWLLDDSSNQANLTNVIQTVDGTTVANDIKARGRFTTGHAEDVDSKARYGLHQDSPSLSDVPDTDILLAYANAEITYRKDPRVTYQIFPRSPTDASVPRLFGDFNIGDTTYLTARRGFVEIDDQPIRVFGATLNIRSDGSEEVTNLQTTAV